MANSYDAFFEALGIKESSGRYTVVNELGYLGKYQMGELALIDAGYYKEDSTKKNDFVGDWTGKNGVKSKQDYLNNKEAQEDAVRRFANKNWGYAKSLSGAKNYSKEEGYRIYEGQILNGQKITISGILGGMHLLGIGGLRDYITSGGITNSSDANGVTFSKYLKDLAGFETPFTVNHNGNDTLTGGNGSDELRGYGGDDLLQGGGGTDTAVFSGSCSEYSFTETGSGQWTVSHVRGTKEDKADTLKDIEFVRFSNGTFELKTGEIPCAETELGFIIDTTGSMKDDIDAVKRSASSIINSIFNETTGDTNARIGIVGYKDPGESTTILSFTDQEDTATRQAAALDAINRISIGGGGDDEEGVYSALLYALQGGLGDWREAAVRRLVLFGDAPPKDAELAGAVRKLTRDLKANIESDVPGVPDVPDISISSLSRSDNGSRINMTLTANTLAAESVDVEIFTVVVGSDLEAQQAFQQIADENSGRAFTADNADNVVTALLEAINAESFTTAPAPTPIDFNEGTRGIRLRGTNRADELIGTADNDRLTGLRGNDNLNGKAGNNRLDGGDGRDTLAGGRDRDLLLGRRGNDSLTGGGGDDILVSGLGADTLKGGSGSDYFTFNALAEAGDTIVDFIVASDRIDIRRIVAAPEFSDITSFGGFDALINRVQVGNDTEIRIDQDGNGVGGVFVTLATLRNVVAGNVTAANFVISG